MGKYARGASVSCLADRVVGNVFVTEVLGRVVNGSYQTIIGMQRPSLKLVQLKPLREDASNRSTQPFTHPQPGFPVFACRVDYLDNVVSVPVRGVERLLNCAVHVSLGVRALHRRMVPEFVLEKREHLLVCQASRLGVPSGWHTVDHVVDRSKVLSRGLGDRRLDRWLLRSFQRARFERTLDRVPKFRDVVAI